MIAHVLALWAASSLPTALAGPMEPNLFFNWTFYPMDGQAAYAPSLGPPKPDKNPIWDYSCKDNGTFPSPSQDCVTTARAGGMVDPADAEKGGTTLAWYMIGTNVWVHGETTATQVHRAVDETFLDQAFVPEGDVVLAVTDLPYDYHTVISVYQNNSVTVSSIVTTMGIKSDVNSLDDMPKRVENFTQYAGEPANRTNYNQTIDAELNSFYQGPLEATSYGAMAKVNTSIAMQVPANTSFLVMRGLRDSESTMGFLTYNPPLPASSTNTNWFSALSSHEITESVLHVAVLDPTQHYNVTLALGPPPGTPPADPSEEDPYKSYLILKDTTFYTLAHPSGRKGRAGAGVIAGAVVGGVAAIALLTVLLVWWRSRRNADDGLEAHDFNQIEKCAPGEFEIDENDESGDSPSPTPVTPYPISESGSHGFTTTASLVEAKMRPHNLRAASLNRSQGHQGKDSKLSNLVVPPPRGSSSSSGASPSSYYPHTSSASQASHMPSWMDDGPIVQESDAGIVPQHGPEPHLVPPRYDPAWRQEGEMLASAGSEEDDVDAPVYEPRGEGSTSTS